MDKVEGEEKMEKEEDVSRGCPPRDIKLLQVTMPPKR